MYKSNFSKSDSSIPFKWCELGEYLSKHNLKVEEIVGDGFCFLNLILNGLDKDYGIKMMLEDLKHEIITYLLMNIGEYVNYHEKPKDFDESIASMKDIALSDIMDFLKNQNYIDDIVDVLTQVVADCLKLNINVFQRNTNIKKKDNIQKIQICGGTKLQRCQHKIHM